MRKGFFKKSYLTDKARFKTPRQQSKKENQ